MGEEEHQRAVTMKLLKIKEYILSSNILLQIKLQRKLHPHFYTKNNDSNSNNPYAFHSSYYCPIVSKQDIYIFLSTCRQEDNVIVQELLSCGCTKLASLHDLVEHLCQVLVKNRVLYKITSNVFYIPSLLHHHDCDNLMDDDHLRGHASSVWTYKCVESWKVTLCHSWTFMAEDGHVLLKDIDVMSTVISGILSKLISLHSNSNGDNKRINIRHASCWKNACYLVLSSPFHTSFQPSVLNEDNSNSITTKENVIELFLHWVDVSSDLSMSSSSSFDATQYKELRVSAKGQCGAYGKRIHQGGYKLTISAIDDIINKDKILKKLKVTKEVICPECLAMNSIARSSLFDYNHIIQAEHCGMKTGCNTCIICDYGHSIDTRILTGNQRKRCKPITERKDVSHGLSSYDFSISKPNRKEVHKFQETPLSFATRWSSASPQNDSPTASLLTKSFSAISRAVVLVGLWSPKEKRLISVGSGFIVDKKLGLIVTAAHTLIHLSSVDNDDDDSIKSSNSVGEDYYGCKHGKAIIGVIPPASQSEKQQKTKKNNKHIFHTAIFRYSAEIIAKDVQNVDACILRITTKFEYDIPIQNQGEDIANISAEIPLTNLDSLVRKELLQSLDVTYDFEIQEQIRIIGYN